MEVRRALVSFRTAGPQRSRRHRRHGGSALIGQLLALVLVAAPVAAEARVLRIVALGDSLTAGLGLPEAASFPSVLERRLKKDGFDVEVSNAGVSGDTTTDGLARLDWSTPEGTDFVIVELGANDMLRGIKPAIARDALAKILSNLRDRKIPAALAGMRSLANWGDQYRAEFEAIYPDLATQFSTPLYPFFLDGAAGRPDLTQGDGMHPNPAGVEIVVDRFAPFLEPILKERFGPPSAASAK
ncbi:MAG: arylesterase [Hyphomicrobiales bacterium]|nr:arylesterase [Hyphomicrobiales bacterium]